mmetsp:Transcript_90/g.149  ORF Transcript_90/g.149 Transcript_90/m.149 type:complete len:460 (-) Transcript_90:4-1383(-)
MSRMMAKSEPEEEFYVPNREQGPLLGEENGYTDSVYNHDESRARKDSAYAVLYVFYMLTALAGGFVGFLNKNANFFQISTLEYLQDANHCSPGRSLLAEDDSPDTSFLSSSHYWKSVVVYLVVSLAVSLVLGYVMLRLLVERAQTLVNAAFVINFVLMVFTAFALINTAPMASAVYLLLSGLSLLAYWMWRDQLQMVARLFAVSAAGLKSNPHLVTLVLGVKTLLLVATVPLFAGMASAYQNGQVVQYGAQKGDACFADDNVTQVPCCAWQPDGWVTPFLVFAGVGGLWTTKLAFEIRVFTISGAVAQWYFSPVGSSTRGTTLKAVRHALTSSFGTLCLGSLVLTAVEAARSISERARRQRDNIVMCLVACVLECVYQFIEFISQFATIMAAITGMSFCDSAREVTDLLKRNFLASYAVWWMPGFVLNSLIFTVSLAWASLAGLTYYVQVGNTNKYAEK